MTAAAILLVAFAAGPASALPLFAPVSGPGLPVIQVRDVCRVTRQGDTETTHYCDGGYVCDDQNPGMCKPGPELQRQLDEERRKAEEELMEAERKLAEQLREIRANERAGRVFNGVPTNPSRPANCSGISGLGGGGSGAGGPGCAPPTRLSDYVYDLGQGAPPRYRPQIRRPAQQPTPVRTSVRDSIHFNALATQMAAAIAALQPHDPARLQLEGLLSDTAGKYRKRGVDTDTVLHRLAVEQPHSDPTSSSAEADAASAPEPSDAVDQSSTDAAPAGQAPAEPAAPAVSAKDEALCSYLLTFEEGDANRLGVQVPDYCEPYLRSIGRAPRDPEARDPRQILFDLEDKVLIIQMKREYEAVFAPDLGE
ncbi:hypothetical protein M8R20_17980 [Pseudomonas sp. R2.Fl]|nr:hypothetical protein [Pseudomonas sp. R2.Fl]